LLAALIAIATTLGVLALTSVASGAVGHRHSAIAGNTATEPQLEVCNISGDTGQNGITRPIQEGLWAGGFFTTYPLTAAPSPGNCAGPHSFSAGALIGVEQGTLGAGPGPGVNVAITASNGTIAASVPSIALAVVRVGSSGLTTVTVDDATPPPPAKGTLELCKSPADGFVTGQVFNFTITAPGYSASQSVVAEPGSCNDVPNVPAPGPVTITETQKFPYRLTSVATIPSNALVSSSPQTLSAVVTTLPSQTTTVFFTNATLTGYAKICKVLRSAVDNGLAGQTFTFNVSATFNGSPVPRVPSTVSVTAQSYGNVPCTFLTNNRNGHPLPLPLGTIVTATEVVPSDAAVTATTISPSNLDNGSTPGTAVFFVGNSGTSGAGNLGAGTVTQATFTNEGLGRIKVCKSSSTIATGTVFNFTIGGGVGPTQAGVNTFCSLSFTLPVGTVTIRETPVNHVSTTWTDTHGEGGTGTSATVTVPFNTENKVTFDNEINSGQLQVCKQVDTDGSAFAQTQFPLTYSWTGGPAPVTVNLKPTQCTNTITVPTLTPTLTPVQISIFEGTVPVPLATLTNVMVQGPDTVVSAAAPPNHLVGTGGSNSPNEVLNSLEGITDVNFINTAALPGL
jgi:hypothetical protein